MGRQPKRATAKHTIKTRKVSKLFVRRHPSLSVGPASRRRGNYPGNPTVLEYYGQRRVASFRTGTALTYGGNPFGLRPLPERCWVSTTAGRMPTLLFVFASETQVKAKRSLPRVTEVCSKNPRFFAARPWPDINEFPPFCFWEPHAGIPGRRPQA